MGIQVKPVESDVELRLANELMADAHARNDPALHDWLFHIAPQSPGFQREHIRTLWAEGEMVSALRLTTETMLLGEARLRMGGISFATTARHRRGQGCFDILMRDALDYLRRNNYHVSMVFGIPGLYGRFGYASSLADYSVRMNTVDALGFGSPFRARPAQPALIPELQRIHSGNNAAIPCSILRTTAHFKNGWDRLQRWYALYDEKGKVEAYFIAGDAGGHLRVDDVGLVEKGLSAAVVAEAARLASERSLSLLRFHVPPQHALSRFLLQFRSVHEMEVEHDAGAMMRFVSVGETLESLIPEWESRIAESLLRRVRAEFTFVVEGQPYRIRVNRGAVDVSGMPGANKVSLPAAGLLHLVTGYRHVEDVFDRGRYVVAPDAYGVMQTIFPKRMPYVWRFDRF